MSSLNTRFAVAVHILAYLHLQAGKPVTSEAMARSVNTNPSLIRRLLCTLCRAGLTTSVMGVGGGALLARPAEQISLLDVFDAMDDEKELFGMHPDPNPGCPIGLHIHAALKDRTDAAESAFRSELRRGTVAGVAADILKHTQPKLMQPKRVQRRARAV